MVPRMQGEEILFTSEEIDESIEDICGIASGYVILHLPLCVLFSNLRGREPCPSFAGQTVQLKTTPLKSTL